MTKKKTKAPEKEVQWVECPECQAQQEDMGNSVRCDNCGYGPMPTESD